MTEERELTDWRTLSEAARRIGVHRKTLMRACQEGKLGDNCKQVSFSKYWYVKESWIVETGHLGPPGKA